MINQALFSNKKDYRYILSRFWDESKPVLGIIGLQPSYGKEKKDDPDILQQIDIAKSLGYGGLYSFNLFAFLPRETKQLNTIKNPIGANNNKYLQHYTAQCKIVVCAWGDEGVLDNRGERVQNMFKDLYYFELNTSGQPQHFSTITLGTEPKKF